MSETLTSKFGELNAQNKKALIPYLMGGFPSMDQFQELAQLVLQEDVDALEIGLPFSDPLADGPVIQAAGQKALDQGTKRAQVLQAVHQLHQQFPAKPLVLMSYLNPMRATGLTNFAEQCAKHGISSWIVPDRDLDHPEEILEPATAQQIEVVPLLAPTTPPERIPSVVRGAGGFVYLVSVTGVTGARRGHAFELKDYVARVRQQTNLPLCLGFGISGEEQARSAAELVDGVIVGSALLEPFLRQPFDVAKAKMIETLRAIRKGLSS